MDISGGDVIVKYCFKCEYNLMDSLNIVYNASNSMTVLWNRYQIFLYENLEFEKAAKIIIPEYQIYQILVSNNYLVCLDRSGNIHIISLKFKNVAQKCIKSSFVPREHNILTCSNSYDTDYAISLKCDAKAYYLCLNKINTDFKFENRVILLNNNEQVRHEKQEKCLLKCHVITKNNNECMKQLFNLKDDIKTRQSFIIVSFDKLSVYGFLFHPKMTEEETMLVKLYTCPSEICDIEITDLESIIIGLTIGSLIKLSLNDICRTEIVHLNTAIHKFLILKDSLFYTDGLSLWQVENYFMENIKFNQLSIKHAKSLIKSGDQIIITTFTKLIYIFPIDGEIWHVKLASTEEYCPAKNVLNNSQYLYKIMDEIKKNNALVKKVSAEENYIATLALSKRQDIMDTVINNNIIIYETYEDAIKENDDLNFTEELAAYLEPDTFLYLVKMTASCSQHTLYNVLSNQHGDLRIHITLSHDNEILKTTSIALEEPLKIVKLLIPLKVTYDQINVSIKLIMKMPGALDEKQFIWTVLYRKHLILNSEHFIKINDNNNKTLNLMKSKESMEELIRKAAINLHGTLFEFTDITNLIENNYSVYVKLPENYKVIQSNNYCNRYLNKKRTQFLIDQLNSEDFLKSKNKLILAIDNEKVQIEIINDGISSPLLKVTSGNIKLATNMRIFFSNMIHNDFEGYGPEKEFINHKFYASVENFHKSLRNCMNTSSENELQSLIEQFEWNIIGALPL